MVSVPPVPDQRSRRTFRFRYVSREYLTNTDKQVQPPTATDNGGLRLSAGAYLYDVILQERVKQIQ